MKYFVSDKTIQAIKKGFPMCDVYMPREATNTRKRAINVEILATCEACGADFIQEKEQDFCFSCLAERVQN